MSSTATLPVPARRSPGAHRGPGSSRGVDVPIALPRQVTPTSPAPTVLHSRWALSAVALLAVWLVCYASAFSGLQEHRDQRQAYARFREQLAKETAPLGGAISLGTPVALIDAPAAGIHEAVVVEGTAAGQLMSGPGHRADTPLPGQAGVSVIFGRSVTFGSPFRGIAGLRPGDTITATTGQGRFRFAVTDVRRPGDPLPPALTAGQGRLTLVTAFGAGWRSGWAPTAAVYVDALLRDTARAAPSGRPDAIPAVQQQLAGDSAALIDLVLWLEFLLAANVGLVLMGARWGRWQAWLVGAPVVIAVGWATTETAARLLPNLM